MQMQVIFENGEIIEEEVVSRTKGLIRVLDGLPIVAEVPIREEQECTNCDGTGNRTGAVSGERKDRLDCLNCGGDGKEEKVVGHETELQTLISYPAEDGTRSFNEIQSIRFY